MHFQNLAQFPGANEVAGVSRGRDRSLLRAGLADAAVPVCGLDHGPALAHGERQRLVAEHILAGLAGVDRLEGVPVVGRGDHHGVHVLSVEQLAVVAARGPLLALGRCLHVADRHDLGVRGEVGEDVLAAGAQADISDADPVIGARRRQGRLGDECRSRDARRACAQGATEKPATRDRLAFHEQVLTLLAGCGTGSWS